MSSRKQVPVRPMAPKTPVRNNPVAQEKQQQAEALANEMNDIFPNIQVNMHDLVTLKSNPLFVYISKMLFAIKLNENFRVPDDFNQIESCMCVYSELLKLVAKYEPDSANIVPPIFVLLHESKTSSKEVFQLLRWLCSVKKEINNYKVSLILKRS